MRKMLERCPNCSSEWGPGSEEWQWQQCDCCGWPNPDSENFMKEDEDDFYDDYDDNDHPLNPSNEQPKA